MTSSASPITTHQRGAVSVAGVRTTGQHRTCAGPASISCPRAWAHSINSRSINSPSSHPSRCGVELGGAWSARCERRGTLRRARRRRPHAAFHVIAWGAGLLDGSHRAPRRRPDPDTARQRGDGARGGYRNHGPAQNLRWPVRTTNGPPTSAGAHATAERTAPNAREPMSAPAASTPAEPAPGTLASRRRRCPRPARSPRRPRVGTCESPSLPRPSHR
jgi:hypothetical protein